MPIASGSTIIDLEQEAKQIAFPWSNYSPEAGMGVFIGNMLSAVMVIGALLLLAYLVWGGIDIITAGEDQSKFNNGRTKMTNAAIGLIILGSTVAIADFVFAFAGVDFINFL